VIRRLATVLLLTWTACNPSFGASDDKPSLTTVAEQSGFRRTARYQEVETLCRAFQQRWPAAVRCTQFGTTPEGRPMLALIAATDGTLDAKTARAKNRPIVLMQGGIHAGEIDGKDAGFLALRELLEGKAAKGALERATLVFVPVVNVDGHERFGRWHRPNQVGPEEMGWRTSAQNLNLNRDYVKAEAPEMQALLRLLNEWDPILYVDLHVTDGAQFQHDISFSVAPTLAGDATLRRAGVGLRDELVRRLSSQGSLPVDFYPAFVRDDDPSSGFAVVVSQTRFSQQYWATRNRLGVLVETHSWKDYATRVRITRNSIVTMLELAATQGAQWLAAARAADEQARRIGGSTIALAFENTEHVKTIDFQGYAYSREPSAISGGIVTRYDSKRPQVWRIALRDEVRPKISVAAPRGGYVVPAAEAQWVAQKLALHGIESRKLAAPLPAVALQSFRADQATAASFTFEGRTTLSVEGEWRSEQRDLPAGSLFVPIAQPKAHLVMALFEPKHDDSLLSWGYFNAAFERKEYMEAYVAEDVAAQMLKQDTALKREFERKLSEDPAFAKSPAARLDFFYRRHPSWDERLNLYPVFRVEREL
jgi:hypothetical protein